MSSVYDFSATTIEGREQRLDAYKGKVLLIVNVASECGFTPQYAGLEALQKRYGAQGFSVLGFPSNQFGAQEPGTEAEIANFCERNYGVTFPLFAKIDVNGAGAHPLYKYLTSEKAGLLGTRRQAGRALRLLREARDPGRADQDAAVAISVYRRSAEDIPPPEPPRAYALRRLDLPTRGRWVMGWCVELVHHPPSAHVRAAIAAQWARSGLRQLRCR